MNRHQTSGIHPPLYVLDPGCFTPAYDANLVSALAQRGWQPCWVKSMNSKADFALPGAVSVVDSFFGFLRSPALEGLANHRALRGAAKCASYPLYLASFSNRLLAGKPGVVHVQWALMPLLDSLFWRKWRRRGWMVAYTAHDPKPLAGTLPRVLTWDQSRLWEEADAVIVHSSEGADIVRRAGSRKDSLDIIPPGPPTLSSAIPINEARTALNIPLNIPVILFFGYIKKYKGLEFLLRSLSVLREIFGEFLCVIAGEFKEPSKPYSMLISQLRLQSEVRIVEGYVPEHSMTLYFSACNVVALPYLEASSSGVLLCAYAFGKPVVATATGGNLELVEDGRTGYLVVPGDSIAMAKALAVMLKDRDNASRMGDRGREMVECRYSWQEIAERTEQVYLGMRFRRKPLAEPIGKPGGVGI
jgi:D-inositol-3-phosphate glycosyltransferase